MVRSLSISGQTANVDSRIAHNDTHQWLLEWFPALFRNLTAPESR